MTNLEKIKNMSLHKIAHTMSLAITDCYCCPIYEFCKMHNNDDSHKFNTCVSMWEQWLKREVKE